MSTAREIELRQAEGQAAIAHHMPALRDYQRTALHHFEKYVGWHGNRNRKRVHVIDGRMRGRKGGYYFRVVKQPSQYAKYQAKRWRGPFASRRMAYIAGRSWS